MDFLLQLQYVSGLIFLVFFCNLWIGRVVSKKSSFRRKEAPQPSGALPVIGHLHLLRDRKPLAQLLGGMADKYGPVFMLRLGMRRMLIVSNWEAAKECFTTNDKALASRPTNAAGKHMGYDYAMIGFAPYGSYWRSVRKIATLELLSNSRLEMLKHVRSMEIGTCIKELYRLWINNGRSPLKVDLKQWLGDLAFNIVVNMVAGKRYFGSGGGSNEAWRFRRAVTRFFHLLGSFVPSDMFPFLKGIDLHGHEAAMKSAARELDSLMTSLLEEHRQRRLSQKADGDRDFMDMMLSTMADAEFSELDPDKVVKATSLALILGGTDSTTTSLTSTIAALLDNQAVLKKVQGELDAHVGKDRFVEESDIKNLVYLQPVVKEAFRLYPAAQLLVPHEAIEDCQIQGFHVPAGTRIVANMWKLQRDPCAWPDPCEFKPERFLSTSIDVRGQHFELIPFGSGRRSCPGISFALQVMHLIVARMIQGFELAKPGDGSVEMMSHDIALDLPNSTPLEIVLSPPLPLWLYDP